MGVTLEGGGEPDMRGGRMRTDAVAGPGGGRGGSGGEPDHGGRAGSGGVYSLSVFLGGEDVCRREEVNEGNAHSGTILRTVSPRTHIRKPCLTQGLVLYSAVYVTPKGSDSWVDMPDLGLSG